MSGMDRGPIFIGGLDRSGKTLLRLVLSSHPNIAMTRRSYMWTEFYARFGDLGNRDHFERCLAAMLRHKSMHFLQPDPDRIRQEFWQGEPTYARLFALFHQHYMERLGKTRWGDQLAFVERYADPIFAAFPSAKMIHMVRDPRDRYEASVNPLTRRAGRAGWHAARWLSSVRLARRNQRRYPANYKVVRYETLISQLEPTVRDICSFIGESFEPGMLSMENAVRFGEQDFDNSDERSEFNLVAGAEEDDFPKSISRREMAFLQALTRREMCDHGYPLKPVQFSLAERFLYYLVDWPINLSGCIAWLVFDAPRPS